jgi:hypothetical protein
MKERFAHSIGCLVVTLVVAAAMMGCAAPGISPGRVTALAPGISSTAVNEQVGGGKFEFKVLLKGDLYTCESHQIGHARDEYLFVFRNDRFQKVCNVPLMKVFDIDAPDMMHLTDADYLRRRAAIVLVEPAIASLRDRPAPSDSDNGPALLICWTLGMSPFIVMDSPVLVPLAAYSLIKSNAQDRLYDPRSIVLGSDTETLKARFPNPAIVRRISPDLQWVRYQTERPLHGGRAIDTLVQNGRIVGVFAIGVVDDVQ